MLSFLLLLLVRGLRSTETFEVYGGSKEWKIVENSLPYGLYRARAITWENKIYLMGK